nr:hypothetical protein [Tanacetum cinerariifolium]GEX70333.1 hypothetical protein [Tanacetum cinerariifolium]
MQNQSDVQNHLVGIQADDHDLLVNSDNENEDMLGYESEKYFDDEDTNGTNHAEDAVGTNYSDLKLVKKGITRLYRNFIMKLREKYILPNLNTPSKLNELPTKYSAIVKAEEWVEFVNNTTTDAYKEKSARGKMARSKNVYHHKMGRGRYVFVKEKMIKIKVDEEPLRGIMWLKGRVNKDGEFTDDEIRSLGDKLKEADEKIKEGTLNLDDGTDAMTVMFGKENGGYARGVGSGVTYKRYFHLPQSRQATDKRIELLQTQLDNERRERQQKDVLVKKLSTKMTEKDASKCKLWHLKKSNIVALGTVYKYDGKQMMYNQALPNDCYKVSIDSSLVDAACIADVGNNELKIVKDDVGGFFAWPKNQVILDEEVTPPTTIQKISDYNYAPKLQLKRKNYVSRETMQRQAMMGKSHKSLNYGS